MHTRGNNKASESKSATEQNAVAQESASSMEAPLFTGNQPQGVMQRKFQQTVNGSIPVQMVKAQQETIYNNQADIQPSFSFAPAQLKSMNWSVEPVAQPKPANGLVVQCVGGAKFGMEVTGDRANADVQEGITRLKAIQAAYKLEIKTAKEAAKATFEGGDRADIARQTTYSEALAAAEMTPEGLIGKLANGLTNAGDVISYNGTEVAQIRRGAAQYAVSQAAGGGVANIYKRHTLDGPSGKEFVNVGGQMLRRFAYRGITPAERAAYKANAPLRPMSRGHETEGQMGYNFNAATGAATERTHDADHPTDLEWLNTKAGTNLGAIPNDPALLSFLQTRKGTGKYLSATSTNKPITSNHGAAFTGFGNIQIDLARVPAANILHHYKQAAFDSGALNTTVGRHGAPRHALDWETDRANETVRRNRELVISEIPNAAVSNLTDTAERTEYETEFRTLYNAQFIIGYDAAIAANAALNMLAVPRPVPAAYPWAEDHYTRLQARTDFSQAVARNAGRDAAQPRIDYGKGYRKGYTEAYKHAYVDATYESPYFNGLGNEEMRDFDPPEPDNIVIPQVPAGTGTAAGTAAGGIAGTAAGRAAGLRYAG